MSVVHNKNDILSRVAKDGAVSVPTLRLKQLQKPTGRGSLEDELSGNTRARADFRIRVLYLSKFPRIEWTIKQFRSLGDKLFEIKWKTGAVQWRALGFDTADGFFVVVKVCRHKENVYDPAKCIATARDAKSRAESGKQKVVDYAL